MRWQVQEAKQKFSEVLRHASADGPQFVTRHGEEVAVVLDIRDYRRLHGQEIDFKEFLLTGPDSDELAEELDGIAAARELPRAVEFGEA
ncbi:type II toxin-antitoxin system Phd/YefM family antitoxin [Streptomyces boninensis]|uniref:type II toxin-antitoxin system Phd/YefM family antitoxin n=1 Tax=Streptomyces boninensis TaxID=2039455 RepID=UPI003B21E02B